MKPARLLNPRFVPSQWDLPGGHRFTLAVPPYGTATIRGNCFPRLDRRYGVDSASVRGLNRFNPDEDRASIPVEGTPLLVLPGLRGSDMGLARVLSRLQGREIWVLNPPGMGIASVEPNTEYSLDYLARFAGAVAEHMGAHPILVGHSFGATWAAAAIQHSPTDFAGLVLISPVVHGSPKRLLEPGLYPPGRSLLLGSAPLLATALVGGPLQSRLAVEPGYGKLRVARLDTDSSWFPGAPISPRRFPRRRRRPTCRYPSRRHRIPH